MWSYEKQVCPDSSRGTYGEPRDEHQILKVVEGTKVLTIRVNNLSSAVKLYYHSGYHPYSFTIPNWQVFAGLVKCASMIEKAGQMKQYLQYFAQVFSQQE